MSADKVKNTLPLWLAVAITVVVSLPFGLWLGNFNFALWCSFIVWAEYFALGAQPAVIKTILPSFAFGAAMTGISLFAIQFLSFLPQLVAPGDLAVAVALFLGVGLTVKLIDVSKTFQAGTLPLFNGISMVLAIYFTGSFPKLEAGMWSSLEAALWAIVCAVLGLILGVFNVWILFPRTVKE